MEVGPQGAVCAPTEARREGKHLLKICWTALDLIFIRHLE